MKKLFLFSILSFVVCQSFSKNNDSLWAIFSDKNAVDTVRLKAIDDIAKFYNRNNPDTCIFLSQQQLELATAKGNKKWIGKSFSNIGLSYSNKNDYPKALEYFLNSLKIYEEIGNKDGIATCYNNIGTLYRNQQKYSDALDYFKKSLAIATEMHDEAGAAVYSNNIGVVYGIQADYPKALEYFSNALTTAEKIGDKKLMAAGYTSIGIVYKKKGDYPKALEYYTKVLHILDGSGDKRSFETCYVNMAMLYNKTKDYKLAIQYAKQGAAIAKEIADVNAELTAYEALSKSYSSLGQYKEAFDSHVIYKILTDSIFNEENSKQLGDQKTKYEVEKKETELKAKADALEVVRVEEEKRQQIITYAVLGVLLIVIVFSLFLFSRYRITQKQKRVIEEQKVMVDSAYDKLHEKNKEIIDSINYAKRIQRSQLPTEKYIDKNLRRLK